MRSRTASACGRSIRPRRKARSVNLPGLGQPRAGRQSALYGVTQHDGRSVAGDFDQIFGGVGAGGLKVSDHHLIDRMAFGVDQLCEAGAP